MTVLVLWILLSTPLYVMRVFTALCLAVFLLSSVWLCCVICCGFLFVLWVFLSNAGIDVHNVFNRLCCAIEKAKGNCILTHLGH